MKLLYYIVMLIIRVTGVVVFGVMATLFAYSGVNALLLISYGEALQNMGLIMSVLWFSLALVCCCVIYVFANVGTIGKISI